MNDLNDNIKRCMQQYFKAKDNFQYLTEDNKILVGQVENYIGILPPDNPVKQTIDEELDRYFSTTKELGDTKNMQIADNLRQQTAPLALVRTKPEDKVSSKAAFINVVILLYGMLNIGFIVAVALIRNLK